MKELIEQLQKQPPEAEVYVVELDSDCERDPIMVFREEKDTFRSRDGRLAYPNGRVKL